ncbi:MAG: cell division protein ZapA [Elusimicrobiota bacterium]|jgi:cell division protein ZapA (FtsZ GTPase activity inhibitor)
MINEKVPVEIFRRKLSIEMEGLTPLEIQMLAQTVDERMKEIQKLTGVVDSSKLAILAAMEFAADIHKMREQVDTFGRAEKKKFDEMSVLLNTATGAKAP